MDRRVNIARALSRAVEALALQMLARGQVEVELPPTGLAGLSRADVEKLERRGVVACAQVRRAIGPRFRHQTLLEYAAARALFRIANTDAYAICAKQLAESGESMWLQPVLECLFLLRDREQDPAIVVDLLHCLHHPHGNRRRTALRVLIRSETPWSETLKASPGPDLRRCQV